MALDEDLKILYVPLSVLHPNSFNPNKMSDRQFMAVRESIRSFGLVDPIITRPHPDTIGEYEILGGEHRSRAAGEEGIEEVPIVVLPLDEYQAKKLTIVLNETHGEADPVALSVLLAELEAMGDSADLLVALPYTDKELEKLIAIGRVDWDQFDADQQKDVDEALKAGVSAGAPRFLRFTKDQATQYDTLLAMIMREKEIEMPEDAVMLALRELAGGL